MGVMTPTVEDAHCSAAKPKERQFQVVPVPGVFTRGRWKCCDSRDSQQTDPNILEFPKHGDSGIHEPNTTIVTSVAVTTENSVDSNTITSVASAPNVLDQQGPHDEGFVSTTILPTSGGDDMLSVTDANIKRQMSSATVNIPLTTSNKTLSFDDHPIPQVGLHAIDSKIEQAMDLVKSHLTFAVREEVEELRKTITKLEAKVTVLESQNAFLKKFAPPDVVNNLASLVQDQQIPQIHPKHSHSELEISNARTHSPSPSGDDIKISQ
ncbi:hypothetical protein FO519_005973 [Halicephalobus sp. NKZ332]|nr:hypothetical protein FO519_005973 [Halicephalobus sp. NKZ332]